MNDIFAHSPFALCHCPGALSFPFRLYSQVPETNLLILVVELFPHDAEHLAVVGYANVNDATLCVGSGHLFIFRQKIVVVESPSL